MTQMQVELIDHMGSDLSVIRAATASFANDSVECDEEKHSHLINYLARGMTQADYDQLIARVSSLGVYCHDRDDGNASYGWVHLPLELEKYRHTPTHWSSFAHTAITLRLKAPICTYIQFTKNIDGVTMNVVSDTPELFIPEFREKPKGNIKQGSGNVISEIQVANRRQMFKKQTVTQAELQVKYDRVCGSMIKYYNELIEMGISPEQARFVLPQGVMTEWVWTNSLDVWSRLYNQYTDSYASKELQVLAKMISDTIGTFYPVSWYALTGEYCTTNSEVI